MPDTVKLTLLLKHVAALERDFETRAASTQQQLDALAKEQGDASKVLHVQLVPRDGGSGSYVPT